MSESGRADVGYPKSKVDNGTAYWLLLCGGFGAVQCLFPLGFTQYVYPIRVPKFTVFNRSLLLMNDGAVDIGEDGGSTMFCAYSFGTRKPFYLAFSADGVMTDDEVKAKGKMINQPAIPAYNIFIQSKDLPQPSDPDWDGRIYVHIVWDSPNYLNDGGIFRPDMFIVVKHDMDEKI